MSDVILHSMVSHPLSPCVSLLVLGKQFRVFRGQIKHLSHGWRLALHAFLLLPSEVAVGAAGSKTGIFLFGRYSIFWAGARRCLARVAGVPPMEPNVHGALILSNILASSPRRLDED